MDADEHDALVGEVSTLLVEGGWKVGCAMAGPAGPLLELARMGVSTFLSTGTQRLQKAVQEQIADAALRRLPEVERRVQELASRSVRVEPSDFSRVLNDFAKATQETADAQKRKLLEDAFVNSFNPALYEAGLLHVLWDKLERLSYGALRLLRDMVDAGSDNDTVRNLVLNKNGASVKEAKTIGSFHLSSLIAEALVYTNVPQGGGITMPTELGLMMRKLCEPATPES